MSEFVPDPNFWPHLENAVMREMDDIRDRMRRDIRANLSPPSIRSKVRLKTTRSRRRGLYEIAVWVGYGAGLGPIFERGTGQRQTKAGHERGRISTANHAIERARADAIRRGITLRYL